MKKRNKKIDSFVITNFSDNMDDREEKIIQFADFNPEPNSKIIISVLNEDVAKQIKDVILTLFGEKDVFMIADCPAIKLPK